MTEAEKSKFKDALTSAVPEDGSSIGNRSLMQKLRSKQSFAFTDDDYWTTRNELIQDGTLEKGRGKGGSVFRTSPVTTAKTTQQKKTTKKERELYPGLKDSIEGFWLKDEGIVSEYVVQNTAHGGSKQTGGKWTRPDISVVAVKAYAFIPGKFVEVITFEVKRAGDWDVNAVFETASHSVFATRSYLSLHLPEGTPDSEDFNRVMDLCENFGVGLLSFEDETDWNTFQTLLAAERKNPDPGQMSKFIQQQINQQNRTKISAYLKGF